MWVVFEHIFHETFKAVSFAEPVNMVMISPARNYSVSIPALIPVEWMTDYCKRLIVVYVERSAVDITDFAVRESRTSNDLTHISPASFGDMEKNIIIEL